MLVGLFSPACNLYLPVLALDGGEGNIMLYPLLSPGGKGSSLLELLLATPMSIIASGLETRSLLSCGVGGNPFFGGGESSSGVDDCLLFFDGLPARDGVDVALFAPRPRLTRGAGLLLPLAFGTLRIWLTLGEGDAVVAMTR
jgi:hypothetical protein